jgi:hypothetical protein
MANKKTGKTGTHLSANTSPVQCSLISPTKYEQLLNAQILKAQKDTDDLTVFLRFLGSAHVKVAHKHVAEIDPRFCSINVFLCSNRAQMRILTERSQSCFLSKARWKCGK